jgi:acyl-CoA synthetase (AMP-forming)/AMP-acid ligase II
MSSWCAAPFPETAADDNLAEFVWKGAVPDRIALIEHGTGSAYSYGNLLAAVHRFASALAQHGLRPGDVVAIGCNNGADFVITYHGTLLAGGTVLPLEPRGQIAEWFTILSRFGVRHAVLTKPVWRQLSATIVPTGLGLVIVLGSAPAPGSVEGPVKVLCWEELLNEQEPTTTAVPSARGDARALLPSSSGTQGVPKQVVLTHRNLSVNLDQIAANHLLRTKDVTLGLTPFRHIYGMQMAIGSWRRGALAGPFPPSPFNSVRAVFPHTAYR